MVGMRCQRAPSLPLPWEGAVRRWALRVRKGLSIDIESVSTLILDFLSPGTVGNKYLWFISYPVYCSFN